MVTAHELQTVVFTVEGEEYGIDISKVKEIIRLPEILQLPNTAAYFLGIINLRGNVIPVIDLKRKFIGIQSESTAETRVIVIEAANGDIGLVVDQVSEVLKFSSDLVEPVSALVADFQNGYVFGVAKFKSRLLMLLDVDKLIN
jgi:purine-binding chemotaxis protein CheW